MQLPPNDQIVVDRFITACQADERVSAACLSGSYAQGTADAYSDLDLDVIIDDEVYDDFISGRETFLRQLGEPLFVEDFDLADIVFFIFANGVEGEMGFGRASEVQRRHYGPFVVLLDKRGILSGSISAHAAPDLARQSERLRRQIMWFWHDLAHFITALGRGQVWWAHGQLEALRHICLNLARLKHDFWDSNVGDESYFKIDHDMPVGQLAPLRETFCPLAETAMLRSAQEILQFYRALAPDLAHAHDLPYPVQLEKIMTERFDALCEAHSI